MDVAGHWQREWAGAAEYGKVTEGGVTRRVTRAVEVLNASAPGARIRVMRAAYHSSAGPGVPASSFMLHSSRRVFSSGSRFLQSPSSPTKPLEISSTPLNSSSESVEEAEGYKVTEPDDTEISEPSKWRGSTCTSSIRVPSEESSSIDNASIIDLDSKIHHINVIRENSYDSVNSEIHQTNRRNNLRLSPHLDAPVTLSTLKYKSLLNGSNDWNNRRKSYSFEDTSPLHESISQNNDTIAMESSTDSGICKSTEIVNDNSDATFHKYPKYVERKINNNNGEIDNLTGFTPASGSRISGRKSPFENNITLQSTGKVSITLPVKVEKEEEYQYKKSHTNDESIRKVKKVGFSKTELHFAAESGTVNIIATDEKPPPTYDFRKRRSAFVPIKNNFEKPITLFGEKVDFSEVSDMSNFLKENNEISEFDENTAATKGILKNKIPKPKPYLLGENMVFGYSNGSEKVENLIVPRAVSLINKQLQPERKYSIETTSSLPDETVKRIKNIPLRTNYNSLIQHNSPKIEKSNCDIELVDNKSTMIDDSGTVFRQKLNVLQLSPIQGRSKTRLLRESDLTYFGIPKHKTNNKSNWDQVTFERNITETTFRSVKLIQQLTNSVGSEAECDDVPEYENLYIQPSYAPLPAPRSRTIHNNNVSKTEEISESIVEPKICESRANHETRRSRHRRHEISSTPTISSSRSISEPPKVKKRNPVDTHRRQSQHRAHNSSEMRVKNADEIKNHEIHDISSSHSNVEIDIETTDKNIGKEKNVTQKNNCDTKSIDRRKSRNLGEELRNKSQLSPEKEHRPGSIRNKKSFDSNNTPKYSKSPQRSHERNPITLHDDITTQKETFCDAKKQSNNINQEHRNGSSRRHSKRNEPMKTYEKENRSPYRNDIKVTNISEKSGTNSIKGTLKEKITTKKPSNRQVDKNTSICDRKVVPMNFKDRNDKEGNNTGTDSQNSNRNEYVINYNDKNGTVSSICKIKPSTVAAKRKKIVQERVKDSTKEHKVKPVRNAVPTSTKASK